MTEQPSLLGHQNRGQSQIKHANFLQVCSMLRDRAPRLLDMIEKGMQTSSSVAETGVEAHI